ncbi:MAG TPA: condensation domain-containing protein [Terriglobales bacterium]|jgi:hypothetical protein|nr:condensation domain-containing protein [Terriglobales bacterium]
MANFSLSLLEDGSPSATAAQKLLLYLESSRPRTCQGPIFALVIAYRLMGELDTTALAEALHQLWRAHDGLRLGKAGSNQEVHPADGRLELLECKQIQFQEKQTHADAIAAFLASEQMRPFELSMPALVRAVAGEIAPRDHVLCFSVHCCAADGHALDLLMEELAAKYDAAKHPGADVIPFKPAAPSPVKTADGPCEMDSIGHWQKHFREAPPLPRQALGMEPLNDGPSENTATVVADLDHDGSSAVRELASAMQVTPFIIGLAGWAGWLNKRTGSADFPVSTITLARRTPEQEAEIASYLDLLLLRIRYASRTSFLVLVNEVRESVMDALDLYVPMWELLSRVPELRGIISDPNALLLPFQFLPRNAPSPITRFGNCRAGLLGRFVSRNAGFSLPFDGLLTMKERDRHYTLSLEYRTQVMAPANAHGILTSFRDFLGAAVKAPYGSLHSCDATELERRS